jgi:hypothetical protein
MLLLATLASNKRGLTKEATFSRIAKKPLPAILRCSLSQQPGTTAYLEKSACLDHQSDLATLHYPSMNEQQRKLERRKPLHTNYVSCGKVELL